MISISSLKLIKVTDICTRKKKFPGINVGNNGAKAYHGIEVFKTLSGGHDTEGCLLATSPDAPLPMGRPWCLVPFTVSLIWGNV